LLTTAGTPYKTVESLGIADNSSQIDELRSAQLDAADAATGKCQRVRDFLVDDQGALDARVESEAKRTRVVDSHLNDRPARPEIERDVNHLLRECGERGECPEMNNVRLRLKTR